MAAVVQRLDHMALVFDVLADFENIGSTSFRSRAVIRYERCALIRVPGGHGAAHVELRGRGQRSLRHMAFSETDLSKADQRIAEARGRLARQRETIQKLMQGGHDTGDAEALATIMEWRVEVLEEDRRLIEDEVFAAKAPWG